MDILLDTTIQIERIFKRSKRVAIEDMMSHNDCGSSTYVLGEFKSNMVKDFVTLYNIMQIENNLAGVRDNINDTVFHRSFQRVYYVFNDLCKMYNDDYDLIKEELRTYPKRLERRFSYGFRNPLLNETNCHRAKAQVQFVDGKAIIPDVKCTKEDDFCNSCIFWDTYKKYVAGLENEVGLPQKMKSALQKIVQEGQPLKGNICKSLGDCIISLEALQTTKKMVCTTNIDDFEPICDYIGIEIYKL